MMMWVNTLEPSLWIVALHGFCFALFRELSEHAKENRFKGWGDWWNTSKSFTNKHDWKPSWLFSTALVWVTDAEHFFQFLSFICAILAVYLGGDMNSAIVFYFSAQFMGALKPLTNLR